MSAVYLKLSKSDLFHSGGSADGLINIPAVNDIIGAAGLAIYNSVGMHLGETIQYFLTFDDVIKYIHFGKALGTIQVEGTMYANCSGNLPGLSKFEKAFATLRGRWAKIVIGGIVVAGVMNNASVTIVNDSDTMAHFTFSFSIISY